MKRNKIKTFITYAEFNSGIRSIYPFIRNTNNQIKIVSIQHGHSNENLLSDIKKEFSKDLRKMVVIFHLLLIYILHRSAIQQNFKNIFQERLTLLVVSSTTSIILIKKKAKELINRITWGKKWY